MFSKTLFRSLDTVKPADKEHHWELEKCFLYLSDRYIHVNPQTKHKLCDF